MNKFLIVILLFAANMSYSQEGEFTEFFYPCMDQVTRPYIVYTPKSIDKKTPQPLLVYLHGAISNPDIKEDPMDYIKKSKLLPLAERGGFYLMFSYGQKGATWFDAVGTDMVMGEIDNILSNSKLKINEDKVFLTGFSDGASGALYFSMTEPFSFAGFIAMNGSLNVARKIGEKEVFPENANNAHTYIINTAGDMLYDIQQIQPVVEYLKKFNKNIILSIPEGNHEMSYLKSEEEELVSFIKSHSRSPITMLTWETSQQNDSFEWINNIIIDTLLPKKEWHKPYQLQVFDQDADFGIKYDYSYQGIGLKVSDFKSDTSSAKRMGVKIDDIVIMMEKDSINNPYSPYYYINKMKAGDSTSITVLRDNKKIILKGRFNEGFYYNVFTPNPKSGKIIANIEKQKLDIKTSRISDFDIDFNTLHAFELKSITLNGKRIDKNPKGVVHFKIK